LSMEADDVNDVDDANDVDDVDDVDAGNTSMDGTDGVGTDDTDAVGGTDAVDNNTDSIVADDGTDEIISDDDTNDGTALLLQNDFSQVDDECINDINDINDLEAKQVLAVLQDPFKRSSSSGWDLTINWQTVVIIRNLFCVVTFTFVDDIVGRLFLLSFLFLSFLVHHLLVYPYKHRVLNWLQASLFFLIIILGLIRIFWASQDYQSLQHEERKRMGQLLQAVEMGIVLLPLPLLALFALVDSKID